MVKFWKFELVSSPEDDSGRYSLKVIRVQMMCKSIADVMFVSLSKSPSVLCVSLPAHLCVRIFLGGWGGRVNFHLSFLCV